MTNEYVRYPEPGSIWKYKKHPERTYRVVCVTNTAHLSAQHEPQVVYETYDAPERKWSRSVHSFYADFSLLGGYSD